jgi:hypothetical protein
MSCTQSWWLAGLLICILLIASAVVMVTFLRYCELMAKNEGRQSEWAEIRSDENGLNEYKKEQWRKLPEMPYLRFTDPELHSKGKRLQYFFPAIAAFTLIVIVATVALDTCFC